MAGPRLSLFLSRGPTCVRRGQEGWHLLIKGQWLGSSTSAHMRLRHFRDTVKVNQKWETTWLLGHKKMERQNLVGSAVAGFNNSRTITKASATGCNARQNEYKKGICSPWSLVNNPFRWDSLDASLPLKGWVVFDFSNVTKWEILFHILHTKKKKSA